jgi:serine protease
MRVVRLLPLGLLAATLPLLTGLDACLGLCDYETDPQCEDPTRAQIEGTITVPEAGGASLGDFVPVSGPLAQALKEAMTAELARSPADGVPGKIRTPHRSDRNSVAKAKTRTERYRPSEIIVKTREPARARKADLARTIKEHLEAKFRRDLTVEVRLCGTEHRCLVDVRHGDGKELDLEDTAVAVTVVSELPGLVYAEKNLILQMSAQPNDEFFTLQWHYAAIDLPAAWEITVGDPNLVAAVIDTGILLNHPDLAPRLAGTGADLIDDRGVANDGNGRDNNADDPGDDACGGGCHSYHGSHVAGTMGAATDNGVMVAGITWAGRLLPVRVLGKGGGSLADIADGIEWAVGHDVDGVNRNTTPADVINMSLGGFGRSEVMNDAIASATAEGAIVIVAAGNDDTDANEFTPANAPDAITIASFGNTGARRSTPRKASYSNFGRKVDVAAPGGEQAEDIDGDGQPDGVLSTVGDFVSFYQGTSMAAPHVAGIAMLLKSVEPSLTQEDVRTLLKDSANPDLECPQGCGAGRVSAAAALFALDGGLAGPRVIANPAFARVGLGQRESGLVFKNIGNEGTSVAIAVGGADRDKCTVSSRGGNIAARGELALTVTIERNEGGDDRGECTVTASHAGGAAEARVVWTPDKILALQTVDVGAVRVLDDGNLRVARLVTTSAVQQYRYKLFNLEPGTYIVVGLVDTNNNGSYDDPEDAVGIYLPPREGNGTACPEATCGRVTVEAGERITGADFVVAPGFGGDDGSTGGTGNGRLGDACAQSADCGGGLYCEATLRFGYCTTDCFSDTDCGSTGICVSLLATTGEEYQVCLKSCSVNADCRQGDGYFCDPLDNTCFPE